MPTGRVKIFDDERNYGFLVTENGNDLYVNAEHIDGGSLRSGDIVEYELFEGDDGRKSARQVKVTREAPKDNPIGRTMAPPPSWAELEERERQRRQARRRRR